MPLMLLPEPKRLKMERSAFPLPSHPTIGIETHALRSVANRLRDEWMPRASVAICAPKTSDTIVIRLRDSLKPEEYRLRITAAGIVLEAHSPVAARWGVETLLQIAKQFPNRLPCLSITDWPDFPVRGVYYDVCRGRVPKRERLMEQIDLLSRYKINHIQHYIEHTFQFRNHPNIGKNAGALTPDDILALDAFAVERGVEMTPSLASFGHMANILQLPEYRHLAEDKGVGQFKDTSGIVPWGRNRKGWTLSPANPKIYPFLDSLLGEFLPLFSSTKFNVCCDETFDLGAGQSHDLCKRKGKGNVYVSHLIKLYELCQKYGKQMMFWGDIIRKYPHLIKKLPKDMIFLDWGYDHNIDFNRIRDLQKANLPYYACPGTSGWRCLFPRTPVARGNIHGYAKAAKRYGGQGLLNTDWGDGGHFNFMEFSWPGYLFGAEQAWNVQANQDTHTARFNKLFMNTDDKDFSRALDTLGDIATFDYTWKELFFSTPDSDLYNNPEPYMSGVSRNGNITEKKIRLTTTLKRRELQQLEKIRSVFANTNTNRSADPAGLLPYWIFAVDTHIHAAKKLATFGAGGTDSKRVRTTLAKEMKALQKRFETLWLERNRRSEIRITLKQYQKAIRSLA